MDFKIEVIVKKEEKLYVAKTPTFPNCVGKSDVLDEALEKLALSISRKINNNTKNTLRSVFQKKDYKEIITTSNSEKDDIHRIYNINFTPNQKEILVKYNTPPNSPIAKLLKDNKLIQNENEDLASDNDLNTLINKKNNEENNSLFLYPISLN